MTAEVIINKIVITAEAVFDYEESLGLGKLDRRLVKAEVEDYIRHMNNGGRLLYENYFRCKYLDEDSGQILMLFVYRGQRLSVMQNWEIVGICKADEWTEEAEDDGHVRAWVETRVSDLPDEDDWVIPYRVNQILKNTEKTLIENVQKEVGDAFECRRDKEAAETMALLQGIYFDSRKRRRARKKGDRNRWLYSPYW